MGTRIALLLGCVLVAVVAVACSDSAGPESEDLSANRELWRSQDITTYRYDYRLNCFCGGPGSELVTIEVADGQVVRVTVKDSGAEVPPSELELYPTVEDLFDMVEDWLARDPHDARADYHPDLGYPTDVFIDFIENAIDEELGFIATALVELG
jgi:hypothetical protein